MATDLEKGIDINDPEGPKDPALRVLWATARSKRRQDETGQALPKPIDHDKQQEKTADRHQREADRKEKRSGATKKAEEKAQARKDRLTEPSAPPVAPPMRGGADLTDLGFDKSPVAPPAPPPVAPPAPPPVAPPAPPPVAPPAPPPVAPPAPPPVAPPAPPQQKIDNTDKLLQSILSETKHLTTMLEKIEKKLGAG